MGFWQPEITTRLKTVKMPGCQFTNWLVKVLADTHTNTRTHM